jgi:hypothetical protein
MPRGPKFLKKKAKKRTSKKKHALGDYVLKKGGVTRTSDDIPDDAFRAQIRTLNRDPEFLPSRLRRAKQIGRTRDDTLAIAKKRAAKKKASASKKKAAVKKKKKKK